MPRLRYLRYIHKNYAFVHSSDEKTLGISFPNPPLQWCSGPLVDACVDKDLAIWALWARPRGHAEGARGGITSYGRDGATLEAVDNIDIDQVWRPLCEVFTGTFFFFFCANNNVLRARGLKEYHEWLYGI